ncbi:hypothetical protein LTR91_007335 [Friedmanniomyces endolithicus]|uniref:Yeast cell wall synthesis Kre9/Knh1-like N-terminal domain-containing protein n=1 Tax=Friedmanniomyces endolithicus TaxID=329885 RepID=A0AAN6KPQ9_9PEZI|nr:hypothetical protein LTR94_002776 [Friedmanniomyces endolithicus]KAK0805722.1 hypothetical protein LTR59_003944 [Friedmanniomyces endolithicus]KAK0809787.1 hypothetical protein LTR38_004117 [Friedmanniomyces endolithicus]KAK0820450.1 hypothetical protein LTR75_001613 [Friedmanniomyces endolithicus]KAK0862051.1 hypothetical protein LTS02_007417 [Friedmanniomyces endolithicus]
MLSKLLLASAFAAIAAAQSEVLNFTAVPAPFTDGQAYALTYATNDTNSPVTIVLLQGPSATGLQPVATLNSDIRGGQYVWTPPTTLPAGNDYALQISQGNQVNYFGPFQILAATAPASSSSSSATSSSATTAATPLAPVVHLDQRLGICHPPRDVRGDDDECRDGDRDAEEYYDGYGYAV